MKAKKVRESTRPSVRFREIFRAEHRQIRHVLLDLINAFQLRDRSRISVLLGDVAQFTGPHFRYEEEVLTVCRSWLRNYRRDALRRFSNAGMRRNAQPWIC